MKHACAMCGRERPADDMIYSAFTGKRYCRIELKRCEAGSRRRKKSAAKG